MLTTKNGLTLSVIPEPGLARDPWAVDKNTQIDWENSLSHMNRQAADDWQERISHQTENHQTANTIRFAQPIVTNSLTVHLKKNGLGQPDVVPASLMEVRCYQDGLRDWMRILCFLVSGLKMNGLL